jgi:hypothetical protein
MEGGRERERARELFFSFCLRLEPYMLDNLHIICSA